MLRHSVRSFVRAGRSLRLRYADAGEGGAPALLSKEELKREWKKVAPNLDLPKFPGDLLPARQDVPSSIPEKVTLNFLLPHDSLFEKEEVSAGGTRLRVQMHNHGFGSLLFLLR